MILVLGMGKSRQSMKKPAAAPKKTKKVELATTSRSGFCLDGFVKDMKGHLKGGPAAARSVPSFGLAASGFDCMNAVSFCLTSLRVKHKQIWGRECTSAPSMWALRHASHAHFQDCSSVKASAWANLFELCTSRLHDSSRLRVNV